MSDLKAKVIMVKYLAQGDKHRDQPSQDGNPHSENSALHKLVTTFHYIHPSMWNIILSHNNFAVDSSFAVELYEVHQTTQPQCSIVIPSIRSCTQSSAVHKPAVSIQLNLSKHVFIILACQHAPWGIMGVLLCKKVLVFVPAGQGNMQMQLL